MNDREFLLWIYSRLTFVHGENANCDYMRRLAAIVQATPAHKVGADSTLAIVPPFTRENRYLVIKNADAKEFLSDAERAILQLLGDTVARCRKLTGRREFQCVVVESHWPEYEPTWRAIETRMTKASKEASHGA